MRRAPEQPSGWPRAIAPPLTLSFSSSMPSSRAQARTWEAKASLSSIRSISSSVRPAASRARGIADGRADPHVGGVDAGDAEGDDPGQRLGAELLGARPRRRSACRRRRR